MSDQDPQAPAEDTPDTPAQGTNESAVDYQARYQEAQAWGTRASQEAAEYRRIVDSVKAGDVETLRSLGLDVADPEPDEPQYGTDVYDARIAALEQRLEQQAQEAQQAQQLAVIEQHVERELAAFSDLPASKRDAVVKLAVSMDPTQDGMPDIKGAHEYLNGLMLEEQKAWASTKKAPRSPVGQAGTQQPDLSDAAQRQAFMAQRLAALNDD